MQKNFFLLILLFTNSIFSTDYVSDLSRYILPGLIIGYSFQGVNENASKFFGRKHHKESIKISTNEVSFGKLIPASMVIANGYNFWETARLILARHGSTHPDLKNLLKFLTLGFFSIVGSGAYDIVSTAHEKDLFTLAITAFALPSLN